MRIVLHFTKLGALSYISHLDFQRLWQRLFRIAGIKVAHSQGFNPHPKIRFAVPLATGFESEGELLEVYLEEETGVHELITGLNGICPQGLKILAAMAVPEDFPKLTALVDALQYRITLPGGKKVVLPTVSDELEGKSGPLRISDYCLAMNIDGPHWNLLLKYDNQRTLRPDLIAQHYFPQHMSVEFSILRTGIYTRSQELEPMPPGLSVIFD